MPIAFLLLQKALQHISDIANNWNIPSQYPLFTEFLATCMYCQYLDRLIMDHQTETSMRRFVFKLLLYSSQVIEIEHICLLGLDLGMTDLVQRKCCRLYWSQLYFDTK